jgi:peptidoglycan/xylan/chitin deacetylase (PgdA/CDA1 family)
MIKLIEEFPGIKFTVFFTPLMRNIPLTDYPQALDRLREIIENGNAEVFPHGLTHRRFFKGEFGMLPGATARRKVERSTGLLSKARIPFRNGFKFPWNVYSRAALSVLEELGFILFTDRPEYRFRGNQVVWDNSAGVVCRYVQTAEYRYGRPADPPEEAVVYYHGHAQNIRGNGIRESCKNLISEIRELQRRVNLEFIFCSQLARSLCFQG